MREPSHDSPHTAVVRDTNTAGDVTAEYTLEFPKSRITVEDLIRRRAEEEVRLHNARLISGESRHANLSARERALRSPKKHRGAPIDPRAQGDRAVEAFGRNAFFVLVNDRQAESLTETIEIGLDTPITFLKLTPLIGG